MQSSAIFKLFNIFVFLCLTACQTKELTPYEKAKNPYGHLGVEGYMGAAMTSCLGMAPQGPTPGVVNEGNNILGLKLVYSFSTSIFFIATILVLYKYPLTQTRHEELRRELEEKTSI